MILPHPYVGPTICVLSLADWDLQRRGLTIPSEPQWFPEWVSIGIQGKAVEGEFDEPMGRPRDTGKAQLPWAY